MEQLIEKLDKIRLTYIKDTKENLAKNMNLNLDLDSKLILK